MLGVDSMKKNLISLIILFIVIINVTTATIYATGTTTKDFWGSANNWFSKVFNENEGSEENTRITEIIGTMEDMILVIGTTAISAITIFLGIKYMLGSAEDKASTKEGLMNLVVACLFFFGWNSIKNLLMPNNRFVFILGTDTSYRNPVARIYNIVIYILQFAAIIAIIYIGLKYIFAGIEGKTELKGKSATILIGIILAFCSTGFLTYISKVINEALSGSAS